MKIVFFFAIIVATVLVSFVMYYGKKHSNLEESSKLHVFLLSQNDDGFYLRINSKEFNADVAEEGDEGKFSYVGAVETLNDSARIKFKSRNIDTIFSISTKGVDSIAIGAPNEGKLFFKKY